MSSKKSLLPIEKPSFKDDTNTLFSLSIDELSLLFQELEKKGTLFSTTSVARILKVDVDKASSIRTVLIYLINEIHSQNPKPETMMEELSSIGCDKAKVEFFIRQSASLKKGSVTACNTLMAIERYTFRVQHMGGARTEVYHKSLKLEKDKPAIMFPIVRIYLVSHGLEEIKELHFDLNADSFESFVRTLQDALDKLRTEAETLKRSLGDQYTALISDKDA